MQQVCNRNYRHHTYPKYSKCLWSSKEIVVVLLDKNNAIVECESFGVWDTLNSFIRMSAQLQSLQIMIVQSYFVLPCL